MSPMIRQRSGQSATRLRVTAWAPLMVGLLLVAMWAVACDSGGGAAGSTTSTSESHGAQSGDIEGQVGTAIAVTDVRITVKSLQETFQPAQPVERLSEAAPSPPGAGNSFYQAYVRVENKGMRPVRVDPADFACLVGNTIVSVVPTRSGPPARSLLENTSFDLVLTFEAAAGYAPELIYSPRWYKGTIRVSPTKGEATSSN